MGRSAATLTRAHERGELGEGWGRERRRRGWSGEWGNGARWTWFLILSSLAWPCLRCTPLSLVCPLPCPAALAACLLVVPTPTRVWRPRDVPRGAGGAAVWDMRARRSPLGSWAGVGGSRRRPMAVRPGSSPAGGRRASWREALLADRSCRFAEEAAHGNPPPGPGTWAWAHAEGGCCRPSATSTPLAGGGAAVAAAVAAIVEASLAKGGECGGRPHPRRAASAPVLAAVAAAEVAVAVWHGTGWSWCAIRGAEVRRTGPPPE